MGVELMACSANEGAASEDRRITRSKQALREAFIELTEENGLDGFSASDLCVRAGLNRGTLYNIFGDKDGLLRALEGDIMADLEALQAKMQAIGLKDVMRYRVSKRPMPFLVELFDCLREQGDFLHAVMGPKGDPSFGPACAMHCAPKSSRPSCTSATATIPSRSCNITSRSMRARIWASSHVGSKRACARVPRTWHLSR